MLWLPCAQQCRLKDHTLLTSWYAHAGSLCELLHAIQRLHTHDARLAAGIRGCIDILEGHAWCQDRGILHRDISLGNVLVKLPDGHAGTCSCHWSLALSDLSFSMMLPSEVRAGSRVHAPEVETVSQVTIGTPEFRARESQVVNGNGRLVVHPSTDTPSISLLLWALLHPHRNLFAAVDAGTNGCALCRCIPWSELASARVPSQ